MKKETVEEFLKRGGKIKKVTVTSDNKYFSWNGRFKPYTKKSKENLEKFKKLGG